MIQLENRSHIAEFLKDAGDLEGALACLQNLTRVEEESNKEGYKDVQGVAGLSDIVLSCCSIINQVPGTL